MSGIEAWWSAGERVLVELRGVERAIFARRLGEGHPMTLLHGFPSCSYDWAGIAGRLAERHSLLLPDLLGFGASEKPVEHEYSIDEQADLVEALWLREGVTATTLVAHDYSVTVVQELLARQAAGTSAVELTAVHLLNGGLYPRLHRPEPVQTALLDPVQGPAISAGMTAEAMAAALRPTFAPGFDHAEADADIWHAAARGGVVLHKLIRYMVDRREHERRWVDALETTAVPLSFVWGQLDPISGRHIGEEIRERIPSAPFAALEDVGHWPQLEAPERVVAAVLGD
ncbi:alpha/beta hydrolase [Paraconexibacter antarcticus]|uniref:Alpha/beta hydrolase n=1 Tax=Paraconexibacter antarcticus TaxID=2949664 RepID=A0ABY5DQC6_9ACTN|nr:alpha/beta hydrolase [Paraconexibacter antarcticus]UTI62784.1 alpha/beta hydrolase [Paraconexibacter antarcticus]